jgi:hypothetical protein
MATPQHPERRHDTARQAGDPEQRTNNPAENTYSSET